jgi:hypothetical protein
MNLEPPTGNAYTPFFRIALLDLDLFSACINHCPASHAVCDVNLPRLPAHSSSGALSHVVAPSLPQRMHACISSVSFFSLHVKAGEEAEMSGNKALRALRKAEALQEAAAAPAPSDPDPVESSRRAANPPDGKSSKLGSIIGSALSALNVSSNQPPSSANAAANVASPPRQEIPPHASNVFEAKSGNASHWGKVRDAALHLSASGQDDANEQL